MFLIGLIDMFLRILFTGLLLSGCHELPAMAQQVVTQDTLPNTGTPDSTAILNNNLRMQQNAINAIGGYFNSNGNLLPANGGTGTNISTFPNGSLLVYDASNVGIGTINPGTSGQILASQGAGLPPTFSSFSDTNTSNVIFQIPATVDTKASFQNASLATDTETLLYSYLSTQSGAMSNWTTVASGKFKKIAGVSTATVRAQIWQASSNTAQLKVVIGSVNGTASGTPSQAAPEWVTISIDVSGLTNGSEYDVTVQLSNNNNNAQSINLGNLIIFGS